MLDLLFPIKCFNCGKPKTHLCSKCLHSIPITDQIIYSTSSLPNLTANGLSGVIATADYQKAKILGKAIHLFKYNRIRQLGETLASLMQIRIKPFVAEKSTEWLVIPLPLHRRKKIERGFNQNDIMAAACFQNLDQTKVLAGKQNPLKRIRYTKTQTKLSGKQRLLNVQNVFQVTDVAAIKNKNIIIVDDIITTGSSIKEAAQTLKKAGARDVWGLVLAKD